MKKEKYIITALSFLLVGGKVFSQSASLDYLSIGYRYNTFSENLTYVGGDYPKDPVYYFFGVEEYSEAIMWETNIWGDWNSPVVGTFWTLRLKSKNENFFETFGGGYFKTKYETVLSHINYTYQLQNGEMVDFVRNEHKAYQIDNNVDSISIDTRNTGDGTMPPHNFTFYNIPREELLRMYLTKYLSGIDYILDQEWTEKRQWVTIGSEGGTVLFHDIQKVYTIEDITQTLEKLTKHELSIFRNYMFARYNYKFRTKTWDDFFKKYYNANYNGTKTNDEVMASMAEYEKTILNMIIEIERQK